MILDLLEQLPKMTKKFDSLDKAFNIKNDDIILKPENKEIEISIEPQVETPSKPIDDIRRDYDYARGNLYSLMQKSQEALNGALEIAQESDSPRAYEVAGQLIKNTGEIAEKIMNLQKTLKEIEEDKPTGPTTVNNALFVGTTADLTKLLKQQLNQSADK